jgi:hypothetical protein
MFRDTGLGEGWRGAFEHTGGENESRHLHNRGDRDFVLWLAEPFDWEKTVTQSLVIDAIFFICGVALGLYMRRKS